VTNKNIELVFVSINKGYGGAEKYFDNLYSELAQGTYGGQMSYKRYELENGYWGAITLLLSIRNKVVIYNVSVLGIGLFFLTILKLLGNYVIIYPHVVVSHKKLGSKLFLLRNFFRYLSIRISNEIILISDGNFFELESMLQHKKYHFIYNYVDCENKRPINRVAMSRHIAVIGRLQNRHKKQLDLILALGYFIKDSEIIVHFFGTGPDEMLLKQTVQARGLSNNCIFHGWVTEEEIYEHQFSCIVNNSEWEGMALSVLEGIFNDKIVIARNVTGNRELLYNDFLYKTYEELVDILKRLLSKDGINIHLLNSQKSFIYNKCAKKKAILQLGDILKTHLEITDHD